MQQSELEPAPSTTSGDFNTDMLHELATKAGMQLTFEHVLAFDQIFAERNNVLLTGGAGVGKTTFVREVVIPMLDHLGWKYGVTATTGIAGSHLDGKTINSWLGIGLGPNHEFDTRRTPAVDMPPEEILEVYTNTLNDWYADVKMKHTRRGIMQKISSTDLLMIDEVSMCGGVALLGYIDFFLRHIRDDPRPFGGIQVLLLGDFAQLPPVCKREGTRTDWAFLCPAWRSGDFKVCQLTEVFRQGDKVFAGFLNRRRVGIPMTPEEEAYIRGFVRTQTEEEVSKASFLVATNAEADGLNDRALTWYPGPTYDLPMLFHIPMDRLAKWETETKVKDGLQKAASLLKRNLRLRIGTPVLFTVNDRDGRFVNGTKGFVREIVLDEEPSRIGTFKDTSLVRVWIPPKTELNEDGTKNEGNVITLCRSIHGRNKYEDPEIQDYSGMPQYPAMKQFSLIPATAITIHKSQGMSLSDCTVDLRKSFAPGHVYVALSRLRTAEGLTLVSDRFDVRVDRDVVEFYARNR